MTLICMILVSMGSRYTWHAFSFILLRQKSVAFCIFVVCLQSSCHAVCSYGGKVAAIRMALSLDDIRDAQIEVEAYTRLNQLQGKHVPQLLGYGRSGQGFCVATSYIQVCRMLFWLAVMHCLTQMAFDTESIQSNFETRWICSFNVRPPSHDSCNRD